jgi:uncharacterized protein (TIGR02001 family)
MTTRALLFSALAMIAGPASANSWANGASFYSDRVRRGVSQTDGPGVAAEIKYNAEAGWFAGLWVGNVNYGNVTGESVELLPFFAYGRRFGSIRGEVGVLHHSYAGAKREIEYDEIELTLSRKFGPASIATGTYYRVRNESGGHSWYWFTDARVPLGTVAGAKVALSLHAGLYRDPAGSSDDYADQSVGLFATRGRAIFGLGASNSRLSRQSATPGADAAGTRAYVSFTRMFGRPH